MSVPTEPTTPSPTEIGDVRERVLAAIDGSCRSSADLPGQIEAALGRVLTLLAAEPALISAMTLWPVSELTPRTAHAQKGLRDACAERLRAAADRAGADPGRPPIVEPFLIAAVEFEASRAVLEGSVETLPERAPELRDFMLALYLEPWERTAAAARGGSSTVVGLPPAPPDREST